MIKRFFFEKRLRAAEAKNFGEFKCRRLGRSMNPWPVSD
jgi:hypothetical protein